MIKNNYHETYVIGLKQYHIYKKKNILYAIIIIIGTIKMKSVFIKDFYTKRF